jgi:hypothetical protein
VRLRDVRGKEATYAAGQALDRDVVVFGIAPRVDQHAAALQLTGTMSDTRRRHRETLHIGALVTLAAAPMMASALPVIPNGVGFGIETPAGRGGTVYRVTNLNESGPGSLRKCVAARGPRICVFEVSGTIRLTGDLHVRNPNLTIGGQTAPSPGINLRGAALNINTSDVLVQHIRIRVGDDAVGPAFSNRDALKVESVTPIRNIVVDHCSFAWALDETVTTWENWDNFTFTNNIIAEPLYERSDGTKGGFGLFFGQNGSYSGRAAAIGNLIAHVHARSPATVSYDAIIANNVVYNSYSGSVEISSAGRPSDVSVVANVFIRRCGYGPLESSDRVPSGSRRPRQREEPRVPVWERFGRARR